MPLKRFINMDPVFFFCSNFMMKFNLKIISQILL
jgi:hypothetical protein